MSAKLPAKKVTPKKAAPDLPVVEAPHPQIMSQQTEVPAVEPQSPEPEDLEDMLESQGDESALDRKNKTLYVVGMFVTLGIIVATVAVFLVYLNAPKAAKQAEEKMNVPIATPTPLSVPILVTVEVLNGSGVSGAAAGAARALTDKGYSVVSTGNAKKQTVTQVFISNSLPQAAVTAFLGDLSALFGVSSSSGVLDDSGSGKTSTAGALLILGTK